MNKKAQGAGSSATLLIIITVLIVLYILFLPPQERAELLGTSGGVSGVPHNLGPGVSSDDLFDQHIGRIETLNDDERIHSLPAFSVSTTSEGSIIKSVDSLYVKTSVFETVTENITFRIDEDLTSNVKFSFTTGDLSDGRLIVLLNGFQIINEDYENRASKFISLPNDLLTDFNVLTFGTSNPGWAFWFVNEYQLSNIQLTGTIKDVSQSESEHLFFISEEEIDNLDRVILKFYPDCSQRDAGKLIINVNRKEVFSSTADCGVLNTIELDENRIYEGENSISFETTGGYYLLTNVEVKTILEDPIYPIYYFDLDDSYFTEKVEDDEICGEVDGICPENCHEDLDKDCCFEEADNFWCDFDTAQTNDRCVSFVTESTCERCESGYEDDRGDPPESCEDLCGDDEDDYCPLGCSAFVDRDCCFEDEDNYWCDDIPWGRLTTSVCKAGIEPDEYNSCPDRYYNDDGDRLNHLAEFDDDTEEELKSEYEVVLTLFFPNDDVKRATLLINGREIGVETTRLDFTYDISDFVRSHTNSVEIIPRTSIDITSMKIEIERVSR